MTKTIWKFQLETKDDQMIVMHKGAKILCVQTQHEQPCLWVLVDANQKTDERYFEIFGTGHYIRWKTDKPYRKYIGTYQLTEGALVFHVFEIL